MKRLACLLAPFAFWPCLDPAAAAAPDPQTAVQPPGAFVREDLRAHITDLAAQNRSEEPLNVLVRLDLARPDFARLLGARDLPQPTEEARLLRREELDLARMELEAEAREIQAPLREAVEQLGGSVHQSFWLVAGLAAELPAQRVLDLALDSRVISIELDRTVYPAQNCGGSPPPQWSGLGWVPTFFAGGTGNNSTLYSHGGEGAIQQSSAHGAGYTGTALVSGYPWYAPFRVPMAIADSGFDLETDQWRGGAGCWCPPTTLDVLGGCPSPDFGVHGAFKARVGWGTCAEVSRVVSAIDVFDDVFPGVDGFDTPRAVIWEAGTNFAGYIHGTAVTSLAAGNTYMDTVGDTSPAGCFVWCIPDLVGGGLCGLNGMTGAAPQAELQLLKIGQDQPGSGTTTAVEIAAVQQATADGAWVFNLSYTGDPDPTSLYAITVDQAAHSFDLVVCASAGNLGTDGVIAQVGHGFFNGLIVAATGSSGGFLDAVSPDSSHGPLAWPLGSPSPTVSGRDGVNICAPGGYWTNTTTSDGLAAAVPDETFTQATSYGFTSGMWAASGITGTTLASPFVAGAAAALLAERSDDADSDQMQLTSREVRAILLGQADDISSVALNISNGESPLGYGQGRVNLFASGGFFDQGGIVRKGWVRPSKPTKDYSYSFTQGQQVEVSLTWNRVVFPANNPNCSNLQLEVYEGNPPHSGPPTTTTTIGGPNVPIATSTHPENNYERVVFTAPSTGNYTVRVTVPTGGFVLGTNPDRPVPFAFAIF